jgi:hypothetical protein
VPRAKASDPNATVPPDNCLLRRPAARVFSGKASGVDVERLWGIYGHTLTPERRCMLKGTVATLFNARMNMHLLPNDYLPCKELLMDQSLFQSLFEAAVEMDDAQEVDAAIAARNAVCDLGAIDAQDSDDVEKVSDSELEVDADDWLLK